MGRMRRALAGSVSEGVLRRARCPVMVVRAKDTPLVSVVADHARGGCS